MLDHTLLLKLCLCEPPHPPGVPVLVADLLLHLCVGERLEEGRPRVGVALVAEGQLDDRQVVVAESVRLLVPRNLQDETECGNVLLSYVQVLGWVWSSVVLSYIGR